MAEKKVEKNRTEAIPLHRVLREVYRHYTEFHRFFSDTGRHVIEHSYLVYDDSGEPVSKHTVSISLWDLQEGLGELSPRKREAVYYNVILDWKQREVAERMQITTVSVGQYVEAAMEQLSQKYFYGNDSGYEKYSKLDLTQPEELEIGEL